MDKTITEKKIYEHLGVNIFKKYVLFGYEKLLKLLKLNKYVGYRLNKLAIDEIKNYKTTSIGFAVAHISSTIVLALIFIAMGATIPAWILNIAFNLYCIMVQRYNIIRINEILKRENEKINYKKEFETTKQNIPDNILGRKKEQLIAPSNIMTDSNNITLDDPEIRKRVL